MMLPELSQVKDALHKVYDPCSVTSQCPVSIIDMGMVTELKVVKEAVYVQLRPTNLGCTLVPSIMMDIEEKLSVVPGVSSVSISIDTESTWSPEEMSVRGREMLTRRRSRANTDMPIQPKQWMMPNQEAARRTRLKLKGRDEISN